jgi:TRAP-type C4-dicarboxylate transport system substrate-binding protein
MFSIALGVVGAAQANPSSPTLLTMGVPDSGSVPAAAASFAQSVQRLSGGSLLVAIRFAAQQTADGEPTLVREVERGAVPMGWIPTRAWDAVGLPAFAALQAPFLITNYALLGKVLEGSIGHGMLSGTRTAGIRTLALAAMDLHVPLGAQRPFRALPDFRGATLRVPSNSPLTTAILAALGGKSAAIASGSDLYNALKTGTVDGAVSSLPYVFSNGYYTAAKYLTPNLVFFPYVGSVGINETAFEALTAPQRSILIKAAAAMTRKSLIGLRTRDQHLLNILCGAGLRIATATTAHLAALRRAEQNVYESLEVNPRTANRITLIQALKSKTKPPPALRVPAGCAA